MKGEPDVLNTCTECMKHKVALRANGLFPFCFKRSSAKQENSAKLMEKSVDHNILLKTIRPGNEF